MYKKHTFQRILNPIILSIMILQTCLSAFPASAQQQNNAPSSIAISSSKMSRTVSVNKISRLLSTAQQIVDEQLAYNESVPIALPDPLLPGTIDASVPTTNTIYMPLMAATTSPTREDIALDPDVWMAATKNWYTHEIDEFAIRYPSKDGIELLASTEETQNVAFSSESGIINVSIEPRTGQETYNTITSPPELDNYLQSGYSIHEITVKGIPAWEIMPEMPEDGFCKEILIDWPDAWIHFQLAYEDDPQICDENEAFALVVSSLQIHVEEQHPEGDVNEPASPAAPEWVNYNRTAAYNYAASWWSPNNNDDGYYYWCSGWACDGAHYLAHFMQAGGLSIHWNAGQNHSDSRVANTNSQRNYVVGMSDVSVTSRGNLERGDIIYINNYSTYCWGQAVIRMSGSTPYVSTHSVNTWDVRYDLYYCGSSHWYEFVHIDATADHPANPQLSSNLSLSPATQIIDENVTTAFTARNNGGQSAVIDFRVVTNGAGNFATVNNRTLAAGASYTYNQSRTFGAGSVGT